MLHLHNNLDGFSCWWGGVGNARGLMISVELPTGWLMDRSNESAAAMDT
jgi:hypothetical protein